MNIQAVFFQSVKTPALLFTGLHPFLIGETKKEVNRKQKTTYISELFRGTIIRHNKSTRKGSDAAEMKDVDKWVAYATSQTVTCLDRPVQAGKLLNGPSSPRLIPRKANDIDAL
jgi:hypothetical protein